MDDIGAEAYPRSYERYVEPLERRSSGRSLIDIKQVDRGYMLLIGLIQDSWC